MSSPQSLNELCKPWNDALSDLVGTDEALLPLEISTTIS